MTAKIFIGTSGWSYDVWRDSFYRGVPRRAWLPHYAERFSAVEINASYYRLQQLSTYRKWAEATPARFRFAIKANRYLPAYRRLQDPARSIALERERAQGLGDKLSAVLWQCPPSFRKNLARLDAFAEALNAWRDVRHTIEFRHRSWFDADVLECLRKHSLAVCQSDAADWPLWDAVSTDLVYIRLHGHTRTYESAYRRATLDRWARRVRGWRAEGRTVHVYFDNTDAGAAVRDAGRLAAMLSSDRG
ncbi:MAG: DUF72 domain-containing protein [Gammaproteobacteria bacterium]|nr:DUF72 domain-containing protein [Gammaproteobacteria bacterium]